MIPEWPAELWEQQGPFNLLYFDFSRWASIPGCCSQRVAKSSNVLAKELFQDSHELQVPLALNNSDNDRVQCAIRSAISVPSGLYNDGRWTDGSCTDVPSVCHQECHQCAILGMDGWHQYRALPSWTLVIWYWFWLWLLTHLQPGPGSLFQLNCDLAT